MEVWTRFSKFLANIELTAVQRADAEGKGRNVGLVLKNWYGSSSTLSHFFVGSYSKGTAVRPPRDIDLFFVLPNSEWTRFNTGLGNRQSQLLQEVRSVLRNTFPNTDIRADRQVVTVPFVSFSVEVVPSFESTGSDYFICDTSGGGSWKTASPWLEMVAVDHADERANGNARSLIKMMKVWQSQCNVPIKSFALELLVLEFLAHYEHFDKSTVWYDWMVRDFFGFLTRRSDEWVIATATGEFIWLGGDWRSRAATAYSRAIKAVEYEGEKLSYLALDEWQKIFGSYIN